MRFQSNDRNALKFQDYADKGNLIELLCFLSENKMVGRTYHLGTGTYHLGAESPRSCTEWQIFDGE